jgi:hypothetical protein
MGEKTREGVKSVVDLLERMKHGGGIKGLDDKSNGIKILISESFPKIKPTDPLILGSVKKTKVTGFLPVCHESLSKADSSR